MALTIAEKILARAAGKSKVTPGDNVWVNVDMLLTHDICGPGTIGVFQREFGRKARVWDPEKLAIIPDHYIFTKDEKAHRNVDILRKFVKEQGLPYYYDPGTPDYKGVCHVALPQEGHVRPGEVIFGTDSHTCTHGALGAFATGVGNTDAAFIMGTGKLLIKVPQTFRFNLNGAKPDYIAAKDMILRIIGDIGVDGATYCAMEFRGEAVEALNMDERMTICNMAVEAGGKNGIIEPDDKTLDYVRIRTRKPFDSAPSFAGASAGKQDRPFRLRPVQRDYGGQVEPVYGDADADVMKEWNYDVSSFEPCVAEPHLPSNYAPARDKSDVKLDRAYIGSCTGGKLSDFIMAAKILKGQKVEVDTFLVPATAEVAESLITEVLDGKALVEIFVEAGCRDIAPPSCAACLGGPPDTYGRAGDNEVIISTTNRNFMGRMGSKQALIYLASPLTVAASAIMGRITDPREFL